MSVVLVRCRARKERANERARDENRRRRLAAAQRRRKRSQRNFFSDSKTHQNRGDLSSNQIREKTKGNLRRTFPVRSSPRAISRPRSCSATRSRCRTFLAASLYFSSWTRRRASFRKRGGRETSRDTSSSSNEGAFLEIFLNENETTTFPLSSFLRVPRWCLLGPKKALSAGVSCASSLARACVECLLFF